MFQHCPQPPCKTLMQQQHSPVFSILSTTPPATCWQQTGFNSNTLLAPKPNMLHLLDNITHVLQHGWSSSCCEVLLQAISNWLQPERLPLVSRCCRYHHHPPQHTHAQHSHIDHTHKNTHTTIDHTASSGSHSILRIPHAGHLIRLQPLYQHTA